MVTVQRFHQIVFAASLLAWSWFAMMAVHELGHVIGAWVTGGAVERVVLSLVTISRTDVAPNPHPAVVVWLGPLIGCLLPLAMLALVPRRFAFLLSIARFFAGFCLIANGAYISLGCFAAVGDCGEMLRTGTPRWLLFAFGAIAVPAGLYLWHSLGSVVQFARDPSRVTRRMTYVTVGSLTAVVLLGLLFSPK